MIPSFIITPSIFSVFLILILLLGDSFLRWYLIGFLALFFLLARKNLDFSWVKYQQRPLFLWGIFLGLAIVSAFFTHNVPLSLESLAYYGFAFLVFVTALSVPLTKSVKEQLSFFVVFIGFTLSLLSLLLLFNRSLAASLPGMNLLYPTYGHNHLAAFLLLVLPLGWRLVLFSRPQGQRSLFAVAVITTVVVTLALLLSFGRTALFLGILELTIIWFFAWRFRSKENVRGLLFRVGLPLVVLAFLFVFGAKMYFSYRSVVDSNFICPVPSWATHKLCKPFDTELRLLYFGQAISAMKEYPFNGYGPGTFQLINEKYQQLPFVDTAYAHNHFLQTGAEMGIVAGAIFLLLILTLYWRAFQVVFLNRSAKEKTFSFNKALYISAAGSFLNAWLDFDWNYIGIFTLTLFYLGLILRQTSTFKRTNWRFYFPVSFVSKMIALGLFTLAGLYIFVEFLTRTGRVRAAFDVFPYFKEHLKVFEAERKSFSPSQQQQFLSLYRYRPTAYFFVEKLPVEAVFAEAREEIFRLNPWQNLSSKDIDWYLEHGDYQAADQNLTALIDRVEHAEQYYDYRLGFTRKMVLVNQRLTLADYYLQIGNPQKGAQYYLWARSTEPWIFDHRLPPVNDQSKADLIEFLLVVDPLEPQWWGRHYQNLVGWYFQVFSSAVKSGDEEQMQFWFELIDEKFTNLTLRLWEMGSEWLADSVQTAVGTQDQALAKQKVDQWFKLWELYRGRVKDNTQLNQAETQLAEELVRVSGSALSPSLEQSLQAAADEYLAVKDVDFAEKSLTLLAQRPGENYWWKAQLGHFYVFLADQAHTADEKTQWRVKAVKAFDDCLAAFRGDHDDCAGGKADLQAGTPFVGRYTQVSQIIQGKKRWQDFSD
ncbi:MAG: hypothetical protein UX28_C0001G0063 [Candidatus Pacebacteria bacterium GW2011_GWA1_46_10]|nr:MAG: hypothetical protein UX28_C0001G0063 [Candidatus Pacebacteria bacterium GW2011_GWA1_46_10]HCR80996.1 hypothetical protein [Candidatus Paceibacterota bacterium]